MEVQTRLESLTSKRDRRFGLTSRQLNAVIELLFVTLIATGLLSWIFSLNLASLATTIHSIAGFMLLALVPLKIRGPVRTGFRRKRISRWLSAVFGIMVLAVLIIGVLHANAIWRGYGYWTGMWTHLLVGFSSIPLFLWHVVSRPRQDAADDLDQRQATKNRLRNVGPTRRRSTGCARRPVGDEQADCRMARLHRRLA